MQKVTRRGFSLLTVKAVDEEKRIIRGIATTPTMDREGDIVEPLGVEFKNPMPLLLHHDHRMPVGTVSFDKPTDKGVTFVAELPVIKEPGKLKDRVDEAWQSVVAGLITAVSIGFMGSEIAWLDDAGIRFIRCEVFELSLVTIPAQPDAIITSLKNMDAAAIAVLKSFDTNAPAAPGHVVREVKKPSAGASAIKINIAKGGKRMKTLADQIEALEASRAAKVAAMNAVMEKSMEEGRSTDEAEQQEFDGLETEVEAIDADLKRLRALEKAQAATAKPVIGAVDTKSAAQVRSGIVVKGTNIPTGTSFTRYAIALARSKGNLMQAAEIAKSWRDSTPEVETVLKAAVAAGTTTDANWAKPLVEYQNMTSEFAELLRPATIIGKISNLRRVPFNVKIPRQTGGSSVSWVGQGAPKPVSALAFDQITLGLAKAAGIVVISDELARSSSPAAEELVKQDLVAQTAQFLDGQFVDPAVAAVSNVSPASITNGVSPVVATGATVDHFRADAKALFTSFLTANMSTAGCAWIMSEVMAVNLSMLQNAFGQPEFPGLSAAGGTLLGLPVVTSQSVPTSPGDEESPPAFGAGTHRLILVKGDEVIFADDGVTMLDVSSEASLQMESAPDSPATASTVLTSLWQNNLIGIRAERWVNWGKRRAGAVAYIDGANYG